MPAICKSDGDTPRMEKKRSTRMKIKVEIEKQSDICDPLMAPKLSAMPAFHSIFKD